MAHAEKITFQEFRTRFSTEESCRAELFRLRFPNGFVCPKCGCTEYYPVRGRNTFQCRACRRQTSVTAGTVMHRTHLPLTAWFWAIYLCATDKRGISAVQLSRTLNICYESAWYLLHRIRCAMAQRDENYALSGIVEMDDGYVVAGRTRRRSWWRCQKRKTARLQVVEDVTSKTLQQVVDKAAAPGAKIECDGYRSYKNLSGVELDAKKYESGDLHWLHKAISNLKEFLLGTYHGRCTQLQAYLDEFCFRFNRRKTGDQIFMRLARAVAASCAQLH